MRRTIRSARRALGLVAALAAAGCAPMGGVLGEGGRHPGHGDVLEGEVRRVDVRRGRLDVRGWDGRTRSVLVHRDTRVLYDRREYPVSALERGDEVRVFVSVDRRGDVWAERVDVHRSVRERRPTQARPVHLEGVVRRVSLGDGWFSVDPTGRGREVVVYLPRRLDRRDGVRLDRLRRGQRVWLDVLQLDRDEAELVRFR